MISTIWKVILFACLTYISFLLLDISLQYIPFSNDVAFLRIKSLAVKITYYIPFFKVHVYTSFFLLLSGFTQISTWLRIKYRQIHRSFGWFYAGVLLVMSAPSGLVLAWHANGGWISQLAFVILGVLWMFTTIQAIRYAVKRDWERHREFMIRSYALTLSAISLRLFKYLIVFMWHPLPMDTYRVVAWLSWIVNLIVAEMIIRRRKSNTFAP